MAHQPIDPNPGHLSGDLGNFSPPLPQGSWERLQARRKRRRGAAFWFFSLALLLLAGSGIYTIYRVAQPSGNKEMAQKTPSSLKITKSQHPQQSVPKSGNQQIAADQSQSGKAFHTTTPKPQSINPPYIVQAESNSLPKSASQGRVSDGAPAQNGHPFPGRGKGLGVRGISSRRTNSSMHIHSLSEGQNLPQTTNALARHTTQNRPIINPQKTNENLHISPTKYQRNTNENTSQQLGNQQVANITNSYPASLKPTILPVISIPDTQSIHRSSFMVNNATKADTLMASPQSPIEPAKPEKRKLRFEAGAGLIAFQQQAYTPYNLQPRGETARQATALSGAYGTQAQAALLYPLGKGFWLRPCIGFSALYQQAWVQSSPGPNAQVTLRYNADSSEITGAPTLASTTMRESRILVLPTASLSLLWQPGRLSFFAGSHFTTALTMAETEGAKTGKPTVEAISYHAGARYTLTPNLTLQADARRLNLTQNALPGITGSKSQGWLLGLGLIWNWQ